MGPDKAIVTAAPGGTMVFRIFLVCSFVLLGRPQDVLTFLQPLRPALVLCVLAMVALVVAGRKNELANALSAPETKRYFVLFAIMVAGVPFAWNRGVAFQGVFMHYVINMIFFVLVVSQITSLERLKQLMWIVCLSTLLYGVFGGLMQLGGGGGERFALGGDVFDPNDTAYVLVSLFPLSLYFVLFNEGKLKKIVAIVATFSCMAIILQTGSRGGLIALVAVFLIFMFTKTGGIEPRYKVLFVLIVVAVGIVFSDQVDVKRYMTLTDLSSDYNVTGKEGRMYLWKGAIGLALSNPLTGVGVECFEFAWVIARDMAAEDSLREKSVHNSFLQVASEVGLIGFGVYLLIILKSFGTFRRASRVKDQKLPGQKSEVNALAGLMLVGFVGLLVSGFFLSQGYSIFLTLYFALAVAIRRLQSESAVERSTGTARAVAREKKGRQFHSGAIGTTP